MPNFLIPASGQGFYFCPRVVREAPPPLPQKNSSGAHHFRFRFLDLCIRFGKIISKICGGFNLGANKSNKIAPDNYLELSRLPLLFWLDGAYITKQIWYLGPYATNRTPCSTPLLKGKYSSFLNSDSHPLHTIFSPLLRLRWFGVSPPHTGHLKEPSSVNTSSPKA